MKKIFIGVMIVISFVFVVKISYVQTQNIMGDGNITRRKLRTIKLDIEKRNFDNIWSGLKYLRIFFEDNLIDPDQLKELIIERGITEIKPGAFRGCNTLKKVTLPEGIENNWIPSISRMSELGLY